MTVTRLAPDIERWPVDLLPDASHAERVEGTPEELRLLSSLEQSITPRRSEVDRDASDHSFVTPVDAHALGALAAASHRLTEDLAASFAALDGTTRAALEPRVHAVQKMARTVRALLSLRDEAMGKLRSQGPS